MKHASDDISKSHPSEHFQELLASLERQGLKQKQVAARLQMPPQYISDVKVGRRQMTELFARRVGAEFDVDYLWLLANSQGREPPRMRSQEAVSVARLWLPVLGRPTEGDPKLATQWDGTTIEIAGAAAAQAQAAVHPYVLRIDREDPKGELRTSDLVLVSQTENVHARIYVIQSGRQILLARQGSQFRWEPLIRERLASAEIRIVGACLGLIWRSLV